jgi:hypothetical protein
MPLLRILGDGTPFFASPGQPAPDGVPVFSGASGDTILLTLDYLAWLGAATVAGSVWAINGASIVSSTNSGAAASALILLPSVAALPWPCAAGTPTISGTHILTASDGRSRTQGFYLVVQPAPGVSDGVFTLDEGVLG